MQRIKYADSSLSPLQRLFVELFLEQCDPNSLDSYRARVACPTYILKELYQLIQDQQNGKLLTNLTLLSCRDEALVIMNDSQCLAEWGRVSKSSFIKLLEELKDDNKQLAHKLPLVEYNIYYLLRVNEGIIENLLSAIKTALTSGNQLFDLNEARKIEGLAKFAISELIAKGFSKGFLHRIVLTIFTKAEFTSFNERYDAFVNKVANGQEESFALIFKLITFKGRQEDLDGLDHFYNNVSDANLPYLDELIAKKDIENFLSPGPNVKFVIHKVTAIDHYQAVKRAKTDMSKYLDLIHLGFSDFRFFTKDTVLVINETNPTEAKRQPTHYKIDGIYKNHLPLFKEAVRKLALIRDSSVISAEVTAKIEAALRYLRAGTEAVELEQKFLNYWIGLENIFSDYSVETSTFSNIKKYLVYCHLSAYTKRNLADFHRNIKRMKASSSISNYDDSLLYLQDPATYSSILSLSNDIPLLALRASKISDVYFGNTKSTSEALELHAKNLERHLVRMYRVRNELVHNAAAFQNIEGITSNLRYYLVFIINKALEFFHDCKPKPIASKQLEMRDFFYYSQLIWESAKEKGLLLPDLLKMPHAIDYIG